MYTWRIREVYTVSWREKNRVGTKELRRNLKGYIEGGGAVAIGDDYHVRAILVPVPSFDRWVPGQKRKALAVARRRAIDLLRAELAD